MYQERIMLSSEDILNKEFKIDTRGYRPQEVDKYLDIVIRDYNEFKKILKESELEKRELIEDNIPFDKLDENKFIVSTKEYYMELIRLLLDHLEEHKKIYYSIILSNRNSLVVDIILDTTIKDINKRLNISNIDRKSVPADVIINFYLGAVSMVGLNYLKSDNKYSKQDIINYLSVLIPDNI